MAMLNVNLIRGKYIINEDIKPLELTYSLLKRIFAVIYETRTPNDKLAPAYQLK